MAEYQWIRFNISPCPFCHQPEAPAVHATEDDCNGKLWLDIYSGTMSCKGCNTEWFFEGTTYNCMNCGCKYRGGHQWIGAVTEASRGWIERAGVDPGPAQILGFDEDVRAKFLENPSALNRALALRPAPTVPSLPPVPERNQLPAAEGTHPPSSPKRDRW